MAKTVFSTEERKDIFLYRTLVENLFINEFLPDAPGDCVKVFLFGLMYAQYGVEIDSRTMALTLGLTETDVDNAWKYWESCGLIRICGSRETDNCRIEFIRQIDLFYGKTIEESYPVGDPQEGGHTDLPAEALPDTDEAAREIIARLINQQLRELFDKYQMLTGRTLSRRETTKLTDAIKVYGISPDILDFAIDYCVDIDKYSVDYIFKVALRWKEEGCSDVAEVKALLDRHSRRNEFYRQVFGALGWSRLPSPGDREIMDRWIDKMGYSISEVLDACKASAGLRDPNLRYVNKVLENRTLEQGGVNTRAEANRSGGSQSGAPGRNGTSGASGAGDDENKAKVSRKVLKDYYDFLRQEEETARKTRIGEARLRIPGMKELLAEEAALNRSVSFGTSADARARMQQIREKRLELESKKRRLLSENGYPEDYLDRRYRCGICKDTGYTDEGMTCTCCRERAEEAFRWFREIRKQQQ